MKRWWRSIKTKRIRSKTSKGQVIWRIKTLARTTKIRIKEKGGRKTMTRSKDKRWRKAKTRLNEKG